MYLVKRPSKSEFVSIRGLRYHVRVWGTATQAHPPLFMLHGWMDVAASFQFVVDALHQNRWIIAPDWRGFGLTRSSNDASALAESFWHPDYLADLDALLDHYAGPTPIDLLGHSMGGNVAMMYAGVRPERIRRLINLEGFGLPKTSPSQAPGRLGKWLDDLQALRRGALALKTYPHLEGVANRLIKTNPRLTFDQARWLAGHWAQENPAGQWQVLGEAAHKVTNPYLYRVDEALQIHRCIKAPTLVVDAAASEMRQWWQDSYTSAEFDERLQLIAHLRRATVPEAGHMLHHDQPAALASLIEDFLA